MQHKELIHVGPVERITEKEVLVTNTSVKMCQGISCRCVLGAHLILWSEVAPAMISLL